MTKRILQVVHKYDLSKGFPISSLRKIDYKKSIDEMLWIYSKLSNNIQDLNSHIWDSWAKDNKIEKAYGYQIAKPTMGYNSQIEYVIETIKTNPTSRRIMMNWRSLWHNKTKSESTNKSY